MNSRENLKQFIINNRPLLNLAELQKKSGTGQRLRRFVLGMEPLFSDMRLVDRELVKLYNSLDKYLTENKIIEPKGLFK